MTLTEWSDAAANVRNGCDKLLHPRGLAVFPTVCVFVMNCILEMPKYRLLFFNYKPRNALPALFLYLKKNIFHVFSK